MTQLIHTAQYPEGERSTRRIEISFADGRLLAQVKVSTPGWSQDLPGGATIEELNSAIVEAKRKLGNAGLQAQITCPDCRGEGTTSGLYCGPRGCLNHTAKCSRCDGQCFISEEEFHRMLAGEKLSKDRIARGVTLRQEAERLGMTGLEYCNLERGIVGRK